MTTALTLPAHGSTIIFDRVAPGSYASAGEAYRVNVRGKGRTAYVHLTSVARGSSTFDRGYDYRFASFRTVEG